MPPPLCGVAKGKGRPTWQQQQRQQQSYADGSGGGGGPVEELRRTLSMLIGALSPSASSLTTGGSGSGGGGGGFQGVTTFEAEESGVLRALLHALVEGRHRENEDGGKADAAADGGGGRWRDGADVGDGAADAGGGGGGRTEERKASAASGGDGGQGGSSLLAVVGVDAAVPVAAVPAAGDAIATVDGGNGAGRAQASSSLPRVFAAGGKLAPPAANPSADRSPGNGSADDVGCLGRPSLEAKGGSASTAGKEQTLTGGLFFLEVGKALLTPGPDGRLPMENVIATTQGCLQALTDDVLVVHHGGDTEAGRYRALVRPFTVRLCPGPAQKPSRATT
ncbi:unnamed protein product, partial [Scytosiphon promiscuus]